MGLFFTIFVLALTVKEDRTPLRNGCAGDSDVVTTLAAGSSLTVRYALAGESVPCYKVSVQDGGKTVEGYLAASAMVGLEDFEKGRRDAAWLDTAQVMAAIRSSSAPLSSLKAGAGTQSLAERASQLIETSQPGKALELLEPEIRSRKDPGLMALAGVAAWRADDSHRALELWRGSLDMQPNRELETLYRRVERETKGDQSTDKLYGVRVQLRYDSATVSVETARLMVGALDEEYARISGELGCYAEERILAIIQSREAYRKSTDVAEWSAGQYDGRIRVPVLGGQGMDLAMRRVLAHETTHACLTMLGRWPAWLQEGVAQKLSGDALTPALRQKIAAMVHEHKVPRLGGMRQDWSRLDTEHAVVAYAVSLAAVELLYENYGRDGVRNLVRNPDRLEAVTADLNRRLGL
jgi:hypothetical protein